MTVKVTSDITFDELIKGVLQLPAADFERFIQKIQELKQYNLSIAKSQKEQNLTQQIKRRLSNDQLKRLQLLEQKHSTNKLTKTESQEMNNFIQQIEQIHTQRILAIGMLAQLRSTTVEQVSQEFGFQPIANG